MVRMMVVLVLVRLVVAAARLAAVPLVEARLAAEAAFSGRVLE